MEEKKSRSQLMTVLKTLSRNKMAIFGLIILLLLLIMGILADFIAPYDYAKQDLANAFQHPNAKHLFGTDEFGRDIFSRIIYGARTSLLVGFVSVGIAVVVGGALGAVAGYYGKRIDNFIMRLMDVLLAIPQTLLAIAIVAALGTGLTNLMIAVGISAVPTYARIVRASVLTIREEEYIEAAKASGTTNVRIIVRHILPNCIAPVIVQVTLGMAGAILTAAGMSFIGLGIQPPNAEWGNMLSTGRDYIRGYSYMTMFPGLAIVITVLSLNLLGDGLRDALDPKLRN
ncbi:MAG: ABC transporter permease [Dorea sp.]|jgi:peptide/nickel transport system permease protein|nr:ABC transporter permease [Dorea sp.]MDE6937230.1 ABC transporter permease [Lachnospiraceae bacterium]